MRLALFGGTFDPIHNAHLTVAHEAAGHFQLDQVWFVPAAHPPHKSDQTSASYEDRFRMTELACQVDPRFVASRLEAGDKQKLFGGHRGTRARAGRAALLHHRRRCVRRNHELAPLAGFGPPDRVHRRHAARPSVRHAARSPGASAGNRCAAGIFFRNKAKAGCGGDSPRAARSRRPVHIRARSLSAVARTGGG